MLFTTIINRTVRLSKATIQPLSVRSTRSTCEYRAPLVYPEPTAELEADDIPPLI